MSSRTSMRSSSALMSDRVSGASHASSMSRTRGTTAIDCFRPTRSRGPALPSAARATRRSRSCTCFKTSRNLPRSVLRKANSSTASRRSRMRSSDDERAQQPRAQQAPGHGGDRPIDLVEQGALAAAVHRFDDFEMLERDRVDEQAVGRCLVGDAADVREVGFLRVAQIVEQRAGGRHGGRVSVEPEPFEPVRAELVDAACGAPIRARTSTARRASPAADRRRRRAARGSNRDRLAATISRGRSTITSSASACRPAAPAYSAQENSPVVRSRSATPNDTGGLTPIWVGDS